MFVILYLKTLHVKYIRDETGSTLWSECSLGYVMCRHLHRKLSQGEHFNSIKSIL